MLLDATLLNTQHYEVRIKSKVEQSRERSSSLPLQIGVVAIKKGAFGSPSTTVTNFTLYFWLEQRSVMRSTNHMKLTKERIKCMEKDVLIKKKVFSNGRNMGFLRWTHFKMTRGCPRGVMVKAMDCGIVVREFVLQLRFYDHFLANTLGKGMNPVILPAIG